MVLARALVRSPDLLVLDEPVRGVDYAGEAELYTLIGRLRSERGFGVLLVSHDLHVVMAQSDRVICLNRHVCCSGVPQSVAQHPEYARLFGPQAARAFGLYHHHHDHSHDLAGEPQPASAAGRDRRQRDGELTCPSRSCCAPCSRAWGWPWWPRRSAASWCGAAWPTTARRWRRRA